MKVLSLPFLFVLIFAFQGFLAIAEDGVTASKVTFGYITNVTGVANDTAVETYDGVRIYMDTLNKAGGINGRTVEMKVYDDKFDPKNTIELAKKAIDDDKVFGLYGVFGTAQTSAILPMAKAKDIPVVNPRSSADDIRKDSSRNLFMVRGGTLDEMEALVKYAVNDLKLTKFALFQQNDALGTSGRIALNQVLNKYKLKTVAEVSHVRNDFEFSKQIAQLKAAKPDAVVMWSVYKGCAELLKQGKKAGLNVTYIGGSPLTTNGFLKDVGDAGEGMILTHWGPLISNETFPIVKEYKKECAAAGVTPSIAGLEGYAGAKIAAEALKRAGKNLSREAFRKAYFSIKDFDIGGIKVSYSETDHIGIEQSSLGTIKGGEFVPLK